MRDIYETALNVAPRPGLMRAMTRQFGLRQPADLPWLYLRGLSIDWRSAWNYGARMLCRCQRRRRRRPAGPSQTMAPFSASAARYNFGGRRQPQLRLILCGQCDGCDTIYWLICPPPPKRHAPPPPRPGAPPPTAPPAL